MVPPRRIEKKTEQTLFVTIQNVPTKRYSRHGQVSLGYKSSECLRGKGGRGIRLRIRLRVRVRVKG
jgi:hypothetical protein